MTNSSGRGAEQVRPLAGAGIEISQNSCWHCEPAVRPLAGAGIEICSLFMRKTKKCWFAPSRGRELKYNPGHLEIGGKHVRPLAGAGIEISPQ